MSERVPRYEPTPFPTLVRGLSEIRGIPGEAIRPLAALTRVAAVETDTWEAEVWRELRTWLDALIAMLEARGAHKSDAIPLARGLLDLDTRHPSRPAPRAILVTQAVEILKASGCTTDESLTIVGQIYPLVGWRTDPASRSTVRRQYYSEKTKELRALDSDAWGRMSDRYRRLADTIEAKDRS